MANMISIKRFLEHSGDVEAYRQIVALLLEGIALNAVEGDKSDYEKFRQDIQKIDKQIAAEASPPALFVIVGAAVRAIEEYKRQTARFVKKQSDELQHMVAMLTRTLITIGDSSEHSVSKLQAIEKQIESTSQIEDIQLLKLRLGECLEAVRHESQRQKTESAETLQALRTQLDTSQSGPAPSAHPDVDSITGLLNFAQAEKAIRMSLLAPKNKYVVVVAVGCIQSINARFGYAVGDDVLNTFKTHFEKALSGRDRLFRWRGPALIALLDREEPIEHLRTEIRRFADAKLQKTIQLGMRSVMIPISAAWSVFPAAPPADGLIHKIEAFLGTQIHSESSA
jgi:GGDEF domain-containing protein